MSERLQKIISSAGLMSRRAAEECILQGRVTLNGAVAKLGDRADVENDIILVDSKRVLPTTDKVYIMLNKPKAYVTTLSDEKNRKNVAELVKDLGVRVYPVGRLDMYSEGLLIMTNDGEFANKLAHPSNNISKTYITSVMAEDIGPKIELMRQPMEIDGYLIRPAQVEILRLFSGGAELAVTIHEGRNRQVRKMCELAGLKLTRLCRVKEGPLELGDLKSGKWRHLTLQELEAVRGEHK